MPGVAVVQGGLFSRAGGLADLVGKLEARGVAAVESSIDRLGFASLDDDALRLSETVQSASHQSAENGLSPGVALLLYSKGGAAGLKFLHDSLPGAEHVRSVTFVASPVNGTQPIGAPLSRIAAKLSGLSGVKPVEELVPDSHAMSELRPFLAGGGRQIRMHAIQADIDRLGIHGYDGFIRAREATLPTHPLYSNEVLRGVSHLSVIDDDRVADSFVRFQLFDGAAQLPR